MSNKPDKLPISEAPTDTPSTKTFASDNSANTTRLNKPFSKKISWTRLLLCLLAVICYISFGAKSNIVETIAFALTLWSAFLIDITPLNRIDHFDLVFAKLWKNYKLPDPGQLSIRLHHIFPWLRRLIAFVLLTTMTLLAFQQPLALAFETTRDHSCIQWNLSALCRSGLGIDTILTSQGYPARVGLIKAPSDGGPFDQSDLKEEERYIEDLIFAENATACLPATQHTTIVVATFLNRSVIDTSTSATIGLQDLQGAFLMQREHNADEANHIKLCLVIANIGDSTSNTLASTLEPVMERIMLYARNDPTFGGILGLPFSSSAINGLKLRDQWHQSHIPIISPSASSTQLNTILNFWRIALSDDEQARVLTEFLIDGFHTQQNQEDYPPIAIMIDKNDPYSESLSASLFKAVSEQDANVDPREYAYSVRNPRSIRDAVDQAVAENAHYIFLAGYSAALIHVEERLREIQTEIDSGKREATLPVAIFGGDGIYDLDRSIERYTVPVFSTVYASPLPVLNPLVSDYTEQFGGGLTSGDFSLMPPHVVLSYTAMKAFSETVHNLAEADKTPTLQNITETLATITFNGPGDERISFTGSQQSNPRDKAIYVLCTDAEGALKLAARYEIGRPLDMKLRDIPTCH